MIKKAKEYAMIGSKKCFTSALVLLLCGCGGDAGSPVVIGPPRPIGAIATANEIANLEGTVSPQSLAGRSGTAVLSGLIAADLTSGTSGNRAILGESNLSINFDSGSVTGNASNFAEAVVTTNSGQIVVTQWLQSMNGIVTQSGELYNTATGTRMSLSSIGELNGSMRVNGQVVPGVYSLSANGNVLSFMGNGSTVFAVSGDSSSGESNLEVYFTPNSGGTPILVCMDGLCPSSVSGLSVEHLLRLN